MGLVSQQACDFDSLYLVCVILMGPQRQLTRAFLGCSFDSYFGLFKLFLETMNVPVLMPNEDVNYNLAENINRVCCL